MLKIREEDNICCTTDGKGQKNTSIKCQCFKLIIPHILKISKKSGKKIIFVAQQTVKDVILRH
jgi:hypothetical protein